MQIREAESLLDHNTLRLPARARAYVETCSGQELSRALEWARSRSLPPLPLGQGSNVVFAGQLEALVVHQRDAQMEVLGQSGTRVLLRVSAAHDWHTLVCRCLELGYHGLENLALIPGTVGAAPIQNIGAYGVELERFVEAVHGLHIETGEHLVLTREECAFAYRDSVFKHMLRDQVIITAVDFLLSTEAACEVNYPALQHALEARGVSEPAPRDVFAAVVDVRKARLPDPEHYPNAGSFFHNPQVSKAEAQALGEKWPDMPQYPQANGRVKLAAAWLIERAGWKGQRAGDVGVSPGHALVLVNYGSASGADLLAFAENIQRDVADIFGVALGIEPRVYGARL